MLTISFSSASGKRNKSREIEGHSQSWCNLNQFKHTPFLPGKEFWLNGVLVGFLGTRERDRPITQAIKCIRKLDVNQNDYKVSNSLAAEFTLPRSQESSFLHDTAVSNRAVM